MIFVVRTFLDLVKVNEGLLINLSDLPSVIRVGSTNEIKELLRQYRRNGYEGTMYYAMTQNMRECEDLCILNARRSGQLNYIPHNSISPQTAGYVYIIQET
jgi:hypothetical protein